MIKPIKTEYRGVKFRSRLEANVAHFFNLLSIKWDYEPKSFLLSVGKHYRPDFYLPEFKIWVEAKGVLTEEHIELYLKFCEEYKSEMLIIEPKNMQFISYSAIDEEKEYVTLEDVVEIGKCSHCGSVFFCGKYQSYHCRACEFHNGNNDLLISSEQWELDFYDLNRIKELAKQCITKAEIIDDEAMKDVVCELHDVLKVEGETHALQPLKEDFYLKVRGILKEIDSLMHLPKAQEYFEKIEALMRDIVSMRLFKILKIASQTRKTRDFIEYMTVEEKTLFKNLNTFCIAWKDDLFSILSDDEIKDKVLLIIKTLDKGKGASYKDILEQSIYIDDNTVETAIKDLLAKGIIWEHELGLYKEL